MVFHAIPKRILERAPTRGIHHCAEEAQSSLGCQIMDPCICHLSASENVETTRYSLFPFGFPKTPTGVPQTKGAGVSSPMLAIKLQQARVPKPSTRPQPKGAPDLDALGLPPGARGPRKTDRATDPAIPFAGSKRLPPWDDSDSSARWKKYFSPSKHKQTPY